ncbi:hypothetical protein N7491_001654 [Penicillium cf. griseofulvum]|uniref:Cytochrome P450 n=1 Tax=Penicillium cf. griseofulvum TaxID=2972120 RepID=A0A9W9MBK4_9EURO|nr:hypothetical protein N7472_006783 [Penicillium cf. griseofulvum]KAJ5445572.1 hypothetical protein N7491_001654 [Penicillium cf. griseofulvum]KAJ5447294.1 hypothetical protein N7445_002115 [Penicillium cf. griseofulvum]
MLDLGVVAIIVGLLAHQLVFIHGEWHLKGPSVVVVHLLFGTLLYAHHLLGYGGTQVNLARTIYLAACYLSSLFTSIAVYRLIFHRLRHFPGPRLAAVSKLWHVWNCRESRGHLVLQAWHEEYGEFVRTGPAEVTIFHPEAYEAMDGHDNRNTRSDWYDLLYPRISSIFTRDRQLHHERRKMWEQALSKKALLQYHRQVVEKVRTLESLVASQQSRAVLLNELMYFFAFDSMGDFAFSEDFGMMRNKRWYSSIAMLRSALTLLGPFSPAIWIPRLGFAFIPTLWKVRHWFHMLEFCDQCMAQRVKKTPPDRDIASWFIEDHVKHGSDPARARWLSGDTATLVVAGSDTTAPSLTILFYFLARYPIHTEKIYEEIREIDRESPATLATLPHLTGNINEAMRLLPAVLTFSSRVTPPEGLTIDGMFIPGNTKICAPRYTIGRLETAYVNPHEFIPERWYSKPELIKDKRAFAPFGVGRTSCVGRHLALAQIRLVTAALVFYYWIKFGPGENNGEAVERDMKDQLTAQPGACRLVFQSRVQARRREIGREWR